MRLVLVLVTASFTIVAAQPKPDRDRDGIIDSADRCPNNPEDQDGFQDADGCPDPDNDADGVVDTIDKCPNAAEDKDTFEDADGCPDFDNDADGILDPADKCPNDPEDKDGFTDLDGCADADNDADGILDPVDKCPNEAEKINGNMDDDGCPDAGDSVVQVLPDRIEILEPIKFMGSSVKLAKASANVLGQVSAALRAHTDIVRLRVTVHVHPRDARDQELSDKRAQTIREWIVQWGISATRVEARGMGSARPLKRQSDKGSAEVNDRVEFIILERK